MDLEAPLGVLKEWMGAVAPRVGLVLGSGLSFFADQFLADARYLDYSRLPGFPRSTVEGHRGRWVLGHLQDVPVLCMQGRFHFYEGYDLEAVTLPIRLMRAAGVTGLVLTNAAGGIDPSFRPGDFMLIDDHINAIGANPLRGPNPDGWGPRFPDMTEAWDGEWRTQAVAVAEELGIGLRRGTYIAVSGPSFETPAEIRAFRALGADAVGMSTVPECIVARHSGMRVAGFSCITNAAAGLNAAPLTHEEVAETARRVGEVFARLLSAFIVRIASVAS